MIKMSVFNKINDKLIVDTFKNVFQRRRSEVFLPDIPEFRTIQKYMLHFNKHTAKLQNLEYKLSEIWANHTAVSTDTTEYCTD